jgi:hypothetical protein
MKKRLLNKILFILFLFPLQLFAQTATEKERDITGLWKGSLYNDTTKKNLPYEIAISEEKGKLVGYSYTQFDIDGKKEIGVKSVKIKRKDDQLTIEDVELISNNYSEPPPKKVRQLSVVNLVLNDTAMQLIGNWSTNRTKEYVQLTGSLQLQRSLDYKPLALFKKLEELKLASNLSFVKNENKRAEDIAENNKPATEIKSTVPAISQTGDVDRAKDNGDSLSEKKAAGLIAKQEPAKKENVPAEQPIVKAPVVDNSKTIIIPVTGEEKKVVVANNDPRKENGQSAIAKSKPVSTEQVTTLNEPVKKEIKPATETAKKPVPIEKPTAPIVTEVNNKPVPVVVVNEPIKKEMLLIVAAPIALKAAANVAERSMNNEQSVFFESDSLQLTLYDNGDVDGDTVSVLMNGQIIFAKQGLSTKANSKTIYTGKGMPDSLSMVMYAENLGSIPPNTGLLVIMDGEKRYEVRFSADLKTNAAILLRRIKKEK